ncbi:hypothetical protein Efla_000182 [Eimeria flavescens]
MALWAEDEDFKFPQRKDLMLLDSIKPQHPPGVARFQTLVPSSLRPADACVPGYIANRREKKRKRGISACRFNRPDLHSPDDITRPNKRPLSGRRPRDLSLKTDDIKESELQHAKFKTSRVVNPLDPQYVFPSYEEAAPVEIPFVRDTLDVRDINHPQPSKERHSTPRPPLEGCKPDALHLKTKFPLHIRGDKREFGYMDTKDINADYRRKPPPAGRNPVDPCYVLRHWGASNVKWQGGPQTPPASQDDFRLEAPKESHPRQHARALNKPELCLDTSAIEGATPKLLVPKEQRRGADLHGTLDIEGAQADTHARGLKSSRRVDPLNPTYKWEGGDVPYPQGPECQSVRRGKALGTTKGIRGRSFDLLSNEPKQLTSLVSQIHEEEQNKEWKFAKIHNYISGVSS